MTGTIGSNAGLKGSVQAHENEDNMGGDHSYEWDNAIQDSKTFSFYNTLMEDYDLIPITMP